MANEEFRARLPRVALFAPLSTELSGALTSRWLYEVRT